MAMEAEATMEGVENPIAADEEQPGDDAVVPTTSDDAGSALLVEAVDRATDRPSSWHQATIQYFMDASLRGAANKMYAVALVIVLGQYLVSISIVVSTFNRPCMSNDGCDSGEFCLQDHYSGRCQHCGGTTGGAPVGLDHQEDALTGDSYNDHMMPDYVGFNETYVAEVCHSPPETKHGVIGTSKACIVYTRNEIRAWCEACVVHPPRRWIE
jgi:hypothetical protein